MDYFYSCWGNQENCKNVKYSIIVLLGFFITKSIIQGIKIQVQKICPDWIFVWIYFDSKHII